MSVPSHWWWEETVIPCHVDLADLEPAGDEVGLTMVTIGRQPSEQINLDEVSRAASRLNELYRRRKAEALPRCVAAAERCLAEAETAQGFHLLVENEKLVAEIEAMRKQARLNVDPKTQRLFAKVRREREAARRRMNARGGAW